ncbi:hypothetical protein [Wolbachia endosymbiont of Psylliodes chrysocephala]|uniref:hypothetical protein n=1 Tax=Wolbachia endosymbiont of Psylliodes chrysocephala TaxID=2883236 RepID=UPI00209E8945|nr:hypothetical protein [Wolbachia endosymbiont of Psylliodes chrysocephala]
MKVLSSRVSSQCLGTGMTGEGGYLDDEKGATWMTSSLVDSNHNVRTVVCFDTGILS